MPLLIPVITIMMLLMIAPRNISCLTHFVSSQVNKLQQWQPTPVLLPRKPHGWRVSQAATHGVMKSWTQLSNFTFSFMHWRRKWQPTPVFLPIESQGQGSLVGCRLWGRTESDTTEATQQQQQHHHHHLGSPSLEYKSGENILFTFWCGVEGYLITNFLHFKIIVLRIL